MSTNPLKNFIALNVSANFIAELARVADDTEDEFHDEIVNRQPVEPSGGQWRTSGIALTRAGDEYITPLSSDILLMAVQFNERILPGKVRDEHLAEKVAEIQEREGRRCGRKEYAQLREQVEFDLLPKAFVRRSWVYVSFIKSHGLMLIHTSSAKRADDTVAVLAGLFTNFPVDFLPKLVEPMTPTSTLTRVARDGYRPGINFEPTDTAVLRGEYKQIVRVKDMDIGSADVEALMEQNYLVTELGVRMFGGEDGDETIRFVINDKFFFKRIEAHDVKLMGNSDSDVARDEFHAYALMLLNYITAAVTEMLTEMGGPIKEEADELAGAVKGMAISGVTPRVHCDDEDDEL